MKKRVASLLPTLGIVRELPCYVISGAARQFQPPDHPIGASINQLADQLRKPKFVGFLSKNLNAWDQLEIREWHS